MMGSITEIAVPDTVHAVLAARIDRLPAQAKALLNAAAVIGTRFDLDMLRALLPEVEPRHLADLVSAELSIRRSSLLDNGIAFAIRWFGPWHTNRN